MEKGNYVAYYKTMNELFQAMEGFVEKTVYHWKNDFQIDKDIITKNGTGTYIWFLRNSGTHLIHVCGERTHQALYYANVVRNSFDNYKEYCITVDTVKNEFSLSLVEECLEEQNERKGA